MVANILSLLHVYRHCNDSGHIWMSIPILRHPLCVRKLPFKNLRVVTQAGLKCSVSALHKL